MSSHLLHSASQSADDSDNIIRNLVSVSSSQNYDPAQLVANHPIDAQLLQHENPNNCHDLAPGLPLDKYRLNVDPNPQIVRRKPQDKISYLQQVAVRYVSILSFFFLFFFLFILPCIFFILIVFVHVCVCVFVLF